MSDKIEKEIEAIKTILSTLQTLDKDVRSNVLEYVLKRIEFDVSQLMPKQAQTFSDVNINTVSQPTAQQETSGIHIRTFKEMKGPKSALEMAAVVAYYLQYMAESSDRKDTIGTSDLETWFRIADYPLPSGEMRFVLTNARNAGYLDSAGHGEYKLNAIGYNLIKHNLPRKDGGQSKVTRGKKSSAKKVAKKAPKKAAKKK